MYNKNLLKHSGVPTFKPTVHKHRQSKDNKQQIVIRLTHRRQSIYLPTEWLVAKRDVDPSGSITNMYFLNKCEELIKYYQELCLEIEEDLPEMDAKAIGRYLTGADEEEEKKPFELDFVAYTRKYIIYLRGTDKEGTAGNYRSAINSLVKFAGKEKIDIKLITTKFLKAWLKWIETQPCPKGKRGDRTQSLYVQCLRAMHNRAKKEFNDDDEGVVNITNSPFAKLEVHRPGPTRKRALTPEEIRAIRDVQLPEHDCRTDRFTLARDCFMLSFMLVGINSADLYHATDYDGERITYQRRKTKDRRSDHAEISIKVEPEVRDLIEKYRDPDGERVFCFYKMYTTSDIFNANLNKGLKQVGERAGIANLTFYAARHSWATIAVNDVDIDKYTVHESLNHADPAMKVTDIYIKKSWKHTDIANRKVLDYVLNP